MNRLPSRPPRQQPPLRGRLAAISRSAPEQTRSTTVTGNRDRPRTRRRGPRSPSSIPPPSPKTPTDLAQVYALLAKLYQQWPWLFRFLDRPWKWVALGVILILLLSALGRLP